MKRSIKKSKCLDSRNAAAACLQKCHINAAMFQLGDSPFIRHPRVNPVQPNQRFIQGLISQTETIPTKTHGSINVAKKKTCMSPLKAATLHIKQKLEDYTVFQWEVLHPSIYASIIISVFLSTHPVHQSVRLSVIHPSIGHFTPSKCSTLFQ